MKEISEELLNQLHDIENDGDEAIGETSNPNSIYNLDDEIAMFTPVCRKCGKKFFIAVRREDIDSWNNGEHIQDAFHYVPAEKRELLISNTCPSCWNEIFGDDND